MHQLANRVVYINVRSLRPTDNTTQLSDPQSEDNAFQKEHLNFTSYSEMKASTILTTLALAAVAPLASARNCKTGLDYCGHTLLSIGKSINFIIIQVSMSFTPQENTICKSQK